MKHIWFLSIATIIFGLGLIVGGLISIGIVVLNLSMVELMCIQFGFGFLLSILGTMFLNAISKDNEEETKND